MKTKFVIHCSKCNLLIDSEKKEASSCPAKPKNTKIDWAPTSRGKAFTEVLYSNGGFWHQGIGEVVTSEKHLKQRCSELGFISKHEGAYMNRKHERLMMSKRAIARPKEIVKKPTWSGKGANLPVFESYEKAD